jgi:prepilin-type N-terminal cleavage/methylation domain-containing protein
MTRIHHLPSATTRWHRLPAWRRLPACDRWPTPQPVTSSPPRGFTLVELLAVIMIIAMLAALITPAVMRSLSAARAAAVKTEIDMLHMALMNYKNEYGAFPPANMRGLWVSGSANISHPVYRHLQRLFPRISENTQDVSASESPFKYMAQMSPAQALVFWLQGFYDNPQYPLTNQLAISASAPRTGSANGSRKKLFDFDESRLYAASAYWSLITSTPTAQAFSSRNSAPNAFARDYPVYFPNIGNAGVPYVYFNFAAYSAVPTAGPTFNELAYLATSLAGDSTAAWPYLSSNATATSTWLECHWNPDSFQLISAGADGTYGSATSPPVSFPRQFPLAAFPVTGGIPLGTIPSSSTAPGHADNITNFATGPLLEAAEKLLNQ